MIHETTHTHPWFICWPEGERMDLSLTRALNDLLFRHDWLEDPLAWYAGASAVLFALALLILLVVPRTRRAAVVGAIAAPGALAIAAATSAVLPRARPFVAHPGLHRFVAHAADPGFPSDHAAAAFAIATALFASSRPVGAPLLVAAALLAISRVGVGVHYPSDVLAGAVIGVTAALGAHAAISSRGATWMRSRRVTVR
jgi:undecaprenyl-diphosphatase